jgi:hypothetical protein
VLDPSNDILTVARAQTERLATVLPHATSRILPGLGHMGPITHAARRNALIAEQLLAVDPADRQ